MTDSVAQDASGGLANGVVLTLSGPIGAGKTTLASLLNDALGTETLETRGLLIQRLGTARRLGLQALGERLDDREGPGWVAQPVVTRRQQIPVTRVLVVDAVRTAEQVEAIRMGAHVVHVHLTASPAVLRERYRARQQAHPSSEPDDYETIAANATEAAVRDLANQADLVIDTGRTAPGETCRAVIGLLAARA